MPCYLNTLVKFIVKFIVNPLPLCGTLPSATSSLQGIMQINLLSALASLVGSPYEQEENSHAL